MGGEDLFDSCSLGLNTHHAGGGASVKAGPDCPAKILLHCPAGQVDACGANPPISLNHLCVIP